MSREAGCKGRMAWSKECHSDHDGHRVRITDAVVVVVVVVVVVSVVVVLVVLHFTFI